MTIKRRKKRDKYGEGYYSDGCPEGPFGHTKDPKKRRSQCQEYNEDEDYFNIPSNLKVNYSSLPEYIEKLDIENLVEIPDFLLKRILKRSKYLTRKFSQQLLLYDVPILLSLDSANNYAETALRDGLGIDIEIDDDLSSVLQTICLLNSIHFYLKKSSIPKGFKTRFFRKVVDLSAEYAHQEMQKSRHSSKMHHKIRELEGIVKKKSEYKKNDSDDEKSGKLGTKRSRKG